MVSEKIGIKNESKFFQVKNFPVKFKKSHVEKKTQKNIQKKAIKTH